MTISTALKDMTEKLEAKDIPTARLDTVILLEDVTGKDRSWLLAHPEFILQGPSLQRLEEMIECRANHEPLAYIRGKSEFYGREFMVTRDTLQPRPETETIIDLLQKIVASDHSSVTRNTGDERQTTGDYIIVDVGTGSGCLAITAKLEFPAVEVYATEIDKNALKVAKQNAKKLDADVKFCLGNLLQPLLSTNYQLPTTIILANLPYVPDNYTINDSALHEPSIAIFGGEDGLDLYRELFSQISQLQGEMKFILTESMPMQHAQLAKIAAKAGFIQAESKDFIQLFRASTTD